jgi:hypothetical protein
MATSGSSDFTLTARQAVNFALKKLGVLEAAGAASPEDGDDALEELELMLKGWAKTGPNIFTVQTDGSQALTANIASYALTTTKPLRLLEVRYSDANDREIVMTQMTRTEYFELPIKTTAGIPTNYWYDSDGSSYTLKVWPLLSSVTTETIEYTYQRKIEDIDNLANNIDVPVEWLDTVGYCLAQRLIMSFGVKGERAQRIDAMAERLLQEAKDYDREPLITMVPERRYG